MKKTILLTLLTVVLFGGVAFAIFQLSEVVLGPLFVRSDTPQRTSPAAPAESGDEAAPPQFVDIHIPYVPSELPDRRPDDMPMPEPMQITRLQHARQYHGYLEMPIAGATGWAGVQTYLWSAPMSDYVRILRGVTLEDALVIFVQGDATYPDIFWQAYFAETGLPYGFWQHYDGFAADFWKNVSFSDTDVWRTLAALGVDIRNFLLFLREHLIFPDDWTFERWDRLVNLALHAQAGGVIDYDESFDILQGLELISERLYDVPQPLFILQAGTAFRILEEHGHWWRVQLSDTTVGYVLSRGALINLADVVPSIVFDISNAYSSLKRSGGFPIPDVTGYALYYADSFNERLGRFEFIVPVLYETSFRIFRAQQNALEGGNTLVVYEVFRPFSTQRLVVDGLDRLIRDNVAVRTNINIPPWSPGWFISHGVSHHQRGAAVDASLARVASYEVRTSGYTRHLQITQFVMFDMPSAMHELSPQAAKFTSPNSTTFTETMTDGARELHQIFVQAGFSALASEWWHFSDTRGVRTAQAEGIDGDFYTEQIFSIAPGG